MYVRRLACQGKNIHAVINSALPCSQGITLRQQMVAVEGSRIRMANQTRLELATFGFGDRRSSQLSYWNENQRTAYILHYESIALEPA